MAYLFDLLLLILTFVFVHHFIVPIPGVAWVQQLKTKNNKLLHNDLLTLLDDFQYVHDDGVCFGFTLTWAQDVALGIDQAFYQNLNLIRQEKRQAIKKIDKITDKVKTRRNISSEEEALLEIKAFAVAICLAQSPGDYEEIYAKRLNQSNLDAILSLIRHKLAKNLQVKRFFAKTTAFFNNEEAIDYFDNLGQLLQTTDRVSMVLCSENHAVGLKKYGDNWLFIDINYLYQQSEEYPFFILNNEELVIQLYQSWDEKEKLIFNTDFIAADPSFELKRRLQRLNRLYPVFQKQINYANSRQIGFLAIGAQNGDETTVREIIRLANQGGYLSRNHISSAVMMAITHNQRSILNLLTGTRGFYINMVCREDGSTALAIACEDGNFPLVKMLLSISGVRINARNNTGLTPLMLACRSPYTRNSTELFTLLLNAGASLIRKNSNGENALAIAEGANNQAAIHAIQKFAAKNMDSTIVNSTPRRLPSSATMTITRQNIPTYNGDYSMFAKAKMNVEDSDSSYSNESLMY
ncbi:Dot/Icm T4SS effector AnkG/AnkZ/LegA7 [Legionella cardiaca]|uniref:Ankyrin repeat domain-containing protein n=1 Tax=Legionella cardiaca TaxID=1071983 RepID=A0ABY8APE8_9GAMM|nr:Dot/Icm T4SS effector AnkG/AnkZ/LegA7 [Legionella cardiaca]WED42588.1 ankyrin repeat domain-containing protein [Legionella cardiaca]